MEHTTTPTKIKQFTLPKGNFAQTTVILVTFQVSQLAENCIHERAANLLTFLLVSLVDTRQQCKLSRIC